MCVCVCGCACACVCTCVHAVFSIPTTVNCWQSSNTGTLPGLRPELHVIFAASRVNEDRLQTDGLGSADIMSSG